MAIYQWGAAPGSVIDSAGVLTIPGGGGQNLTLKAQDRTIGSGAGGDLLLRCASGTSSEGAVDMTDAGGSSIMRVTSDKVTLANPVPFVNFANATWKKLLTTQTRTSTITP
jgi:hypothetical protein